MSCCFDRNTEPDPASPEALWGNARGCWEAFNLLFGHALSLVGEVFIRREERNQANAFLRGLEALVRRLLLIEATRLAPSPVIPGRAANPGSGNEHGPVRDVDTTARELDTESTASWPAHFHLRLNTLLGAHLRDEPLDVTRASHWPHRHAHRHIFVRPDDEPSPPVFEFAAPLALRLEALRRVIAEPAPFIRRAARALARFRAGNRAPRLISSPRIAGENARFFLTPLNRIDSTALSAVESCWRADFDDTS